MVMTSQDDHPITPTSISIAAWKPILAPNTLTRQLCTEATISSASKDDFSRMYYDVFAADLIGANKGADKAYITNYKRWTADHFRTWPTGQVPTERRLYVMRRLVAFVMFGTLRMPSKLIDVDRGMATRTIAWLLVLPS